MIFNQYVNPVALKKLGWKYYLLYVVARLVLRAQLKSRVLFPYSYCGWLGFELVFIYLYLWETKGRTLEQTAALFDGDGSDSTRESAR